MASEAGEKPFNALRWLREVRDRINEEIADMSGEDRVRHLLLYDDTSGTDGMLSVPEDILQEFPNPQHEELSPHLLSHEINGDIQAVCEADLLLKRHFIRPVTLPSVWRT